jgi:transposase
LFKHDATIGQGRRTAMTKLWVGLDVGSLETAVCVTDEHGAVIEERTSSTDVAALEAVLAPYKSDIVVAGAEAGPDIYLIRKLREAGYPAVVFESHKASKVLAVRRQKTDVNDARGLADVARLARNVVPQVHIRGMDCQRLRTLLNLREQLVRQRVAAEASLRSTVKLYGGTVKSIRSAGALRQHVVSEISRVAAAENIDLAGDLQPLLSLCESIRVYVARLDRQLKGRADDIAICKRFMEIPGVGPICALSFFSAIEDPSRFARVAAVGSYFGLVPKVRQSGKYLQSLRIDKAGDERTRARLIMSARVILGKYRDDLRLKDWGLEVSARAGNKKAWVAVARKLAIVMLSIWKSGGHFQPYPRTTSP